MQRARRYACSRNSDNLTDERTYSANLTANHGSTDIFTNRCSTKQALRTLCSPAKRCRGTC